MKTIKAENLISGKELNVSELTAELVRIPSCSETSGRERMMAERVHKLLITHGIESELVEVQPRRFNVMGTIRGTGGGRSLMLCGHLDTVPAYDMKDHLSGEIRDGRLHGRGSCDMKGPLAAMVCALIDIKNSEERLRGDLIFAGVIDEEEMGKGIEYIANNGPFVDGAVVGEPTGMRLALGHKGLEWIKIDVFGKKVHGGKMENGINAIAMAGLLVQKLHNEYTKVLNGRIHPVLGSPTINVGRIYGGDQPSTVPGICTLEVDRRWVPEETLDQVYKELEDVFDSIRKEEPRFKATARGYYPISELLPHKPFCTELNEPIASDSYRILKRLGVKDPGPTFFPAWTDAGALAGFTEAKCIVVGPGELELAHTSDESVDCSELELARSFYRELAMEYCK
jgi:acetylornithine deacetylase/succinyl-diaminopimelate desuccinylase